jgi:ABC-2 type transport system ATP-binding protein
MIPPEIVVPARSTHLPLAIQTFDLTKTYGANRGIRNINLTIEQGEIFGFLGPNGAGKSTTLRTLLGLMAPTSGRAEIFGTDVHTHPMDVLERVGALPTEFTFDRGVTGRKLVKLFADFRGLTDLSFAEEIAARLDADLDRPIRKLSRGNKQKIGIVQAMFHRPEIIVLDEPTGGLDPLVQESFIQLLIEAREAGQTIFFSSHVLSEIERIADHVGIIRDGEMVAVERPHDLTRKAHRRVHVRYESPLPAETVGALERMPGVEKLTVNDLDVSFSLYGSVNETMRLVTGHPMESLDVERPSLEEIFLTFYGPSGNGGVA